MRETIANNFFRKEIKKSCKNLNISVVD